MLLNSIISHKDIRKFKRWEEEMIDLFGVTYEPPEDFLYRTVSVSKEHVARPDLVSKYVWGDTRHGDLICRLNGIPNPFELNEEDVLIIPDMDEVDNFYIHPEYYDVLEDLTSTDKMVSHAPSYKKPKEKRKPNEAVMGDKRFNIDKTNRIIIY